MSNHYFDFEELRPTGEASQIPDEQLNEGCDADPEQQRMATSMGVYPGEPADGSGECRSCGASIPAGQTKCRFCLTNHLGSESASTDDTADATLLGIVHMVVESTTFYGAVAKGGAAANLLAVNDTERAIDDCTLIYDLDDEPAPQLRGRWPTLPAAVEVASADGVQPLAAARERTRWSGQLKLESHQEAVACLYDESGSAIRDELRLITVLDDAGDQAHG